MSEGGYFVTGASGFVGRHLCRHLRAAGHRVRGLVRRVDPCLAALGVETIRGDLREPGDWERALIGTSYLIHCAANASFPGHGSYEADNVDATRHLLAVAQKNAAGLRRFVFVSTIGAIDRAAGDACGAPLDENSPPSPTSDYGRSKLKAEQLVAASRLPFCIVRLAMVVGADMRRDSHFAVFARMAVRRAPTARFAWPGKFSVVHVDDVAAALALCATHPDAPGRTFFCAGTPVALADLFAQAQPGALRFPMAWAAGFARALPPAVPFKLKAMLLPALTASDSPLRALGWQPRLRGDEALRGVIARERARREPQSDPGGQTVITGAASGLGRALAERLAPLRGNLLLVDRDRAGLERLQQQHAHCRIQCVDLADENALAELLRGPAWNAHPVRELFACAGMGIRGPMLGAAAADHARLLKVNLLARLTLAHAALPGMIRGQFGRVVFVSSSSAFQPLPFMASYAASNAALLFLGEAWGAELAGTGVHVMQVCPGGMATNFQDAAGVKKNSAERLMPPEAVAERILRALARSRATVIISARAHAMALAARLLPRALSVALWKSAMSRLR